MIYQPRNNQDSIHQLDGVSSGGYAMRCLCGYSTGDDPSTVFVERRWRDVLYEFELHLATMDDSDIIRDGDEIVVSDEKHPRYTDRAIATCVGMTTLFVRFADAGDDLLFGHDQVRKWTSQRHIDKLAKMASDFNKGRLDMPAPKLGGGPGAWRAVNGVLVEVDVPSSTPPAVSKKIAAENRKFKSDLERRRAKRASNGRR